MRRWTTHSAGETLALGRRLAAELAQDATVLLVGDLGSGKTVLVQGLAEGLGIDPAEVQSPTFTLVREHSGPAGDLIHIDLYRLSSEDVTSIGIEEMLEARAITVIEWADRLPWAVPAEIVLELRHTDNRDDREILQVDLHSVLGRQC